MRRSWFWALAAGMVLTAGALVWLQVGGGAADRRLSREVARAPHRTVRGRLSFLPYAPAPSRPVAAPPGVRAAAARVAKDPRSSPRLRAGSSLLSGYHAEAVRLLERFADAHPTDAARWSDLAAAHIAEADATGDPHATAIALAAADRALAIDPAFAPARFNRAVAVSTLGGPRLGRIAWETYLGSDSTGGWAEEARRSIRVIDDLTTASGSWPRELERLRLAALNADGATVENIVRRFPQQSRTWTEGEFLGNWARLTDAGKPAEQELVIAAAVAAALQRVTGDRLAADAVSAIRDAGPDARRLLVRAHIEYREGRLALAARRPAEALPKLRLASKHFAEASSPMRFAAAYFEANAATDLDDVHGASATLARLQATVPVGYAALHAQLQWLGALLQSQRGNVDDAFRSFGAAADAFHRLREQENENDMRTAAAALLALLGRDHEAWVMRQRVLESISTTGDARSLQLAIHQAARQEMREEHWAVARSLFRLIQECPGTPNRRLRFDAAIRGAVAAHRSGDARAAATDMNVAAAELALITDPGLHATSFDDLRYSQAQLLMYAAPRRAAALLTECIAFATSHDRDLHLPLAYYERARARVPFDADGALADARESVHQLDVRRQSIGDVDLRMSFASTAASAFELLADLESRRGASAAVLEAIERGRARSLLDRLSLSRTSVPSMRIEEIQRHIATGDVLVYFTALPDRLLVLTVTGAAITHTVVRVPRADLSKWSERLTDAIVKGEARPAEARRLYDVLLRAVAAAHPSRNLVVIADDVVARIPFSALHDGAHWAVERNPITMMPSGSIYASRVSENPLPLTDAIIVSDPATAPELGLDPLFLSRKEAAGVAARYKTVWRYAAQSAQVDLIEPKIFEADVLHVASHARVNENDPSLAALLLAPSRTSSGVWTARAIARLSVPRHMLVVLAACGTAERRGAAYDVSSLTAAFLAAGARNVVGTLWDVTDPAAATFSRQFHAAIGRGLSPRAALRDAQLMMLHSSDPELALPSAWAAFQLVGMGS
ncbi:MAG TPA: CHAT domain-containing protein [Thermoanaerobaculia bacterium]|nr:CHAT domain-containing protein [Thermoanaerobaculia bacterium]